MKISGREFAMFADQDVTLWSHLECVTLCHSDFGIGKIRTITQRPRYIPLIQIEFESRPEVVTFNSESFKSEKVTSLELPQGVADRFAAWKIDLEAVDGLKASASILAKKYNIGIDEFRSSQLTDLVKVLEILEKENAYRWPRMLHARNLEDLRKRVKINANAAGLQRRYEQEGNPWDLVIACSELRRIDISEQVVTLTQGVGAFSDSETTAALFTTRGGALRDVGRHDDAKACAEAAMKLSPRKPHPYNLLGALLYAEGQYEEGDICFDKATTLGAKTVLREQEIRRLLNEASAVVRSALTEHLLKRQPEKYGWVTGFASAARAQQPVQPDRHEDAAPG